MKFDPTFDRIAVAMEMMVDQMIKSVSSLPRLEHFIFDAVDNLPIRFIQSVCLDVNNVIEDLVVDAKIRLRQVVEKNRPGPEKWESLIFCI